MNPERSLFVIQRLGWAAAIATALVHSRWADAALEISVNPAEVTSTDTFSLRALHEFGTCCYQRLEQSISFDDDQIDVYVLLEPPYEIGLPVVIQQGAHFSTVGPLDAGTYHINAELWLRQHRFIGYEDVLFSTGALTFEVLEPQVSVVLEGDYNSDGQVNAADYVVWRDALGSSENRAADGDGSGIVDEADYGIWRSSFGQMLGSSAESNATLNAVPEPVAISIAAAATIFSLYLRTLNRRR